MMCHGLTWPDAAAVIAIAIAFAVVMVAAFKAL